MGTKIYGILAAQNPDNAEDVIDIDGINCQHLGPIIDEHPEEPSMFEHVGAITRWKKIKSKEECLDDKERRCWDTAQVPFLYVEGELMDGTGHPNAEASAATIKFCQRPEIPMKIGFSIDGGILERKNALGQTDEEGKRIARSLAIRGSITSKPCNPRCKIFLANDLTKSDLTSPPPKKYLSLLKRAQDVSAIKQSEFFELYLKLDKLKKSAREYANGFTSVKCWQCGTAKRFFKLCKSLPNRCEKCNNPYHMTDLWKAIKKG